MRKAFQLPSATRAQPADAAAATTGRTTGSSCRAAPSEWRARSSRRACPKPGCKTHCETPPARPSARDARGQSGRPPPFRSAPATAHEYLLAAHRRPAPRVTCQRTQTNPFRAWPSCQHLRDVLLRLESSRKDARWPSPLSTRRALLNFHHVRGTVTSRDGTCIGNEARWGSDGDPRV